MAREKGVVMKRLAALAALAVMLGLAGSALATASTLTRRQPTHTERARIAAADGIPARCEIIFVSTADRHWAIATTNTRCPQVQPGGYSVLRWRGHWRIVTEGDEPGCTVPTSRPGLPKIPRRIWVGLEDLRCT
jgi:hypothetical protein